MSCIVCTRDLGNSAEHRECVITLFKEKKIKSVQDWIQMSSKPRTIIKGRVFRQLVPPTNAETPNAAT